MSKGAKELLKMGAKAVLIKGGHSLVETQDSSKQNDEVSATVYKTLGYAQDYFLSSEGPLTPGEERVCDGSRGVWLRANR